MKNTVKLNCILDKHKLSALPSRMKAKISYITFI